MALINPNEVYQRFVDAGTKWARLDGEATLLEEMTKPKRAQIMANFGDIAINKAEMHAYKSEEYANHVKETIAARTKANIARAEYDAIKAWIDITRTMESSKRAEMNIR